MCKKTLTLTFSKMEISLQWSSKIIAGLQSLERSLNLTRMGLSSVTGEDLTIKNGHPTRFPHVEGVRKAGYMDTATTKKVAPHISDLRWMIVQSLYRGRSLI